MRRLSRAIALSLITVLWIASAEAQSPQPLCRISLASTQATQSVIGISPFYEYRNYFTLRENACEDPGGRRFRMTIFLVDSICPPTWSCPPGDLRHGLYSLGGKSSNDAVSCLLMGENLAIMVFEHDNWEGQWAVFYNGLTLPPAWNDRISSFVVFPRQFQEPVGLHVLAHYTKFLSGGYLLRKFIPMHASPRIYKLRYPNSLSSLRGKRLDRITRTSLNLAWRVCTGTNFTGQCLTVPSNPQDKRLEVWLPANIREQIRSLEMWLISEEGKYGCVDHGGGIVSCTYAQKRAAATAYQNPPQTIDWTAPRTLRMRPPAPPMPGQVSPGAPFIPGSRMAPRTPAPGRPGISTRPPDTLRRCPPWQRWDPRRQRCVSRCPPGWQWHNTWRRCIAARRCPPGQRYDAGRRQCLTPRRCPPGMVWRSHLRRCIRPPQPYRCPPGTRYDPRLRRCRSICPPGQRWDLRLRRCVPALIPMRKITRCRPGTRWDPRRRQCVGLCRPPARWDPVRRRCLKPIR